MRAIFDFLLGLTTEGFVLIAGLIVSLYFATKTAIILWNSWEASFIGVVAVWGVMMIMGAILSFILMYIVHKLLR
jgi:hypothetical protein